MAVLNERALAKSSIARVTTHGWNSETNGVRRATVDRAGLPTNNNIRRKRIFSFHFLRWSFQLVENLALTLLLLQLSLKIEKAIRTPKNNRKRHCVRSSRFEGKAEGAPLADFSYWPDHRIWLPKQGIVKYIYPSVYLPENHPAIWKTWSQVLLSIATGFYPVMNITEFEQTSGRFSVSFGHHYFQCPAYSKVKSKRKVWKLNLVLVRLGELRIPAANKKICFNKFKYVENASLWQWNVRMACSGKN